MVGRRSAGREDAAILLKVSFGDWFRLDLGKAFETRRDRPVWSSLKGALIRDWGSFDPSILPWRSCRG